MDVGHGADGDVHRHAHTQFADLGLVDFALENELVHIGDFSDGGAVVHGVGLNHRAADLDGHIEDKAGDGGAHESVALLCVEAADALAHNVVGVACGFEFLAGLAVSLLRGLIFLARYHVFCEKLLVAVEFRGGVAELDFGSIDAALGVGELRGVGDNFDFGYHIAFFYKVAGFNVDFADNARNLRFDFDFVARFDFAGEHGVALDGKMTWIGGCIDLLFLLAVVVEKYEGTDEYGCYQHPQADF